MKIKTELWAGHEIRFVEKGGEWWAVAKDVAEALNFRDASNATKHLNVKYKGTTFVSTPSGEQAMLVLNEKGLYRLIMRSNKPEAEDFQDWVYEVLRRLRQLTGLEGFQIFRMLDKEHQKEAMSKLNEALRKPVRVDFIKANTIANKAVSIRHGCPKMVKKDNMTPEMLVDRQPILEDTVNLMGLADKYGLDISVSKTIYNGLTKQKTG